MLNLSAADLLDSWEQSQFQPPVQRALFLLVTAYPESTAEALAELSIGQRDALLLSLREQLFGPDLVSMSTCPGCAERVELNFGVADIQTPLVPDQATAEQKLIVTDYEVRFRLPNSLDLLAISSHDESETRQLLLQRCLLEANHQGAEIMAVDLPAGVIEAIDQRMAAVDAQAEIQIEVICPACRQQWLAIFDIAQFLWEEIDAWVQRTLSEVYILASAFGWNETDILKLSARRRQIYMELVANQ